ncbi:methylamine utilization protein [Marinibactrum halimedae]|uniref:Methylamine utilization protein n=1 Tax=Marinibactrum halimedae TaxID=1444977 RepID=A0AA37T3W0_9GAMM|nr:methylamine utilization protein [Marinibactrum halimedae]MCD9460070.1 methylamine utilization protein [Marinibactrum halimedae]GLS26468.1 hypothetical protein GCM10007877_21840 [Marinibactrum halimedae]
MKILFVLLILFCHTSNAVSFKVSISTPQNTTLPNVVVYLIPNKAVNNPISEISIMDQVNQQFKPHILPIQTNTLVHFPNSDSIKHHVYSFSKAKKFELPLYKGSETDPLLFDKPGLIELGCNVHDWMLGYILVVDTPHFAQTNAEGVVEFDLPADKYKVKVWHPRIQDNPSHLEKAVTLKEDTHLQFKLMSELLPSHEEYEDNDEFSDYEF